MGKELTLSELAAQSKGEEPKIDVISTSQTLKNAESISVSDLAKTLPGKPKEEIKDPIVVQNAFESMEKTLNERKERINNAMPTILENAREIAMENEMSDAQLDNAEESITNKISENDELESLLSDDKPQEDMNASVVEEAHKIELQNVSIENNEPAYVTTDNSELSSDLNDIDNLLKDLEDSDDDNDLTINDIDNEETLEETRTRFKESLSELKITSDVIDFSKFKIKQHPVSASVILNDISRDITKKVADWALMATGKSIRCSECSGPELDALKKTINNSNSINGVIESLKFVYLHIIDANKPPFEAWTKTIRTEDIESLYFCLYRACYGDANLLARTCDPKNDGGCAKSSIINTNILDMVKYEDDKVKEKFNRILQMDTTSAPAEIKSTLIAASDNIAIAYTEPTLYTTFIQYSALPANITEKYEDVLDAMAYITGFFKIDLETQELTPIAIKSYPNNINKTIISKLKVFSDILKAITPDQYSVLTTKLSTLVQESKVQYVNPKTTCPECGKEIEEEKIDSVLGLLFTRAQLATIKSL